MNRKMFKYEWQQARIVYNSGKPLDDSNPFHKMLRGMESYDKYVAGLWAFNRGHIVAGRKFELRYWDSVIPF